jgi:3-oxoacyl-[acyl-carrier-protein] synthase I
MTTSLYVVAQGAMTPVGLNATQTCAAVRAGVSAYAESGFLLQNSQWEKVVAACLPLRPKPSDSKPIGRLLALAKPALEQCVTQSCFQPSETALLVGIPERARLSLFKQWYSEDIEDYLQGRLLDGFHPASQLLPLGNVSAFVALSVASKLLAQRVVKKCIVGGVDSLVNEVDISRLEKTWRLHRENESQGVVPGEAATFLAVSATPSSNALGFICGLGLDQEDVSSSVLSDGHPTGKGLERALRKSVEDAGIHESAIGLRISDLNGERYGGMDSMLALSRFYRTDRIGLPIWHPAECVGETGAAVGALTIQLALRALSHGYSPADSIMCELSSESGLRAACIVQNLP